MTDNHWRYFLALETQFVKTLRFVEPVSANYNTYSIEFASILLSAASEVDVVAKLLCKNIDSDAKANKINKYRKCILGEYPKFHELELSIPIHGIDLRPWESWESRKNPDWWKAYNNVKHQRDAHYSDATLDNAMNAVAGLLCILLYYLRPRWREWPICPLPDLFYYHGIHPPGPMHGPPSILLPDSS